MATKSKKAPETLTDEEIIREISNTTGLSEKNLKSKTYMELAYLAKYNNKLYVHLLAKARTNKP